MQVVIRKTQAETPLEYEELEVDAVSVAVGDWQMVAVEELNRLELRPNDLREPTLCVVPLLRPVEEELSGPTAEELLP